MPPTLTIHNGHSIACDKLPGKLPTVIFLPGFFSHRQGTKALWLEQCCRERGQAYVRFDYRGHGESDGRFEEGTITDWLNDTLMVLEQVVDPPAILVGSSMGGWIALLAALKRSEKEAVLEKSENESRLESSEKVAGVVGIASAPDFTRTLIEERMTEIQRQKLWKDDCIQLSGRYQEEPVIITRRLIEDGQRHLLLQRNKLDLDIPVCLIHGQKDADVPHTQSEQLQQLIGKQRCRLILIPDGEHRLSLPQDLQTIDKAVREISYPSGINM